LIFWQSTSGSDVAHRQVFAIDPRYRPSLYRLDPFGISSRFFAQPVAAPLLRVASTGKTVTG
jgi:hypothetical protein